jgi:type 1 fimbria pilin
MEMRHLIIVSIIAAIALCGISASAQNTVTVSGTVIDRTGAVISGAQVRRTNTDIGAVRTAQSAEDGSYSFPALPLSPYTMTATREGFQTFNQSGIVLQVGRVPFSAYEFS